MYFVLFHEIDNISKTINDAVYLVPDETFKKSRATWAVKVFSGKDLNLCKANCSQDVEAIGRVLPGVP